jgi:hypothetical protein
MKSTRESLESVCDDCREYFIPTEYQCLVCIIGFLLDGMEEEDQNG